MKQIVVDDIINKIQDKYDKVDPKCVKDIVIFGLRRLVSESYKDNDVKLIKPGFKFRTYNRHKSYGYSIKRNRYKRGRYERKGKEYKDTGQYYIGLSEEKYKQLKEEGIKNIDLFILYEEVKQYLFPHYIKVKYDGERSKGKWVFKAKDLITKNNVEEWIK